MYTSTCVYSTYEKVSKELYKRSSATLRLKSASSDRYHSVAAESIFSSVGRPSVIAPCVSHLPLQNVVALFWLKLFYFNLALQLNRTSVY